MWRDLEVAIRWVYARPPLSWWLRLVEWLGGLVGRFWWMRLLVGVVLAAEVAYLWWTR